MTSPMTQAEFLDLFEAVFPRDWIESLRASPAGYELLECFAAIGERLALASDRFRDNALAITADPLAYALVTLRLSRVTTAAAVKVKAGSVFSTKDGRGFATTVDASFGIGDDGPIDVVARALLPRYEWNLPAPTTRSDGTVIGLAVTEVTNLILDPPFGDQTISVTQLTAAEGGANGSLDLYAEDLGMPRLAGETDTQLLSRIGLIEEVASPAALENYLASVFAPLGASATIIEVFEDDFTTAYDGPADDIGLYQGNLLAYDDPRVPGGTPMPPGNRIFWGRYLTAEQAHCAFIVVVPNLVAMQDQSGFYDDETATAEAHSTAIGSRSYSFYDIEDDLVASEWPSFYDADDAAKGAVYLSVAAGLRRLKSFGVSAAIVLEGT